MGRQEISSGAEASHQAASGLIRSSVERIANTWERRLREAVPATRGEQRPLLMNTMPEFLEHLAAAVARQEERSPAMLRLAKNHGAQRASLPEYSLSKIQIEYSLLRKVILETLEEEGLLAAPVREIVLSNVEQAVQVAIDEYQAASRTRNEHLEKLIQQRSAELNEALRQRDEFLSIASHELKTPIAAAALKLQQLDREIQKEPDRLVRLGDLKSSVDFVGRQVARVTQMLRHLFDLSRIRTQRLQIEVIPVDLRRAAEDVIARLDVHAQEVGSEVRLVAPEPVVAYVDPTRIEQVFTNLVSNALKYGGGGPVEVRVQAGGDAIRVQVVDQGTGIAPQDRERIFERFARATASRADESLGLGLFITREIVEAHGGRIEVASEPGRGSVFTVTLPLRELPGTRATS